MTILDKLQELWLEAIKKSDTARQQMNDSQKLMFAPGHIANVAVANEAMNAAANDAYAALLAEYNKTKG